MQIFIRQRQKQPQLRRRRRWRVRESVNARRLFCVVIAFWCHLVVVVSDAVHGFLVSTTTAIRGVDRSSSNHHDARQIIRNQITPNIHTSTIGIMMMSKKDNHEEEANDVHNKDITTTTTTTKSKKDIKEDEDEDDNKGSNDNTEGVDITKSNIDGNFDLNDAMSDTCKVQDRKFIQRNKCWVIVVDDEEAIRLAVGDFLYDQGYQVTACADADSMLEVCTNGPSTSSSSDNKDESAGDLPPIPDAIISDIRMPGKDGIELLGLIRADERLTRVPVILLTAKAMTKDRVEGYKAGADVYLSKPFDPNELLSIIDNCISRRKQMSGTQGNLLELKQDMENIKQIMRKNAATVVKKTDVYLSDLERDILELICKGYTNGEIASSRGVSVIAINRVIQQLYLDTGTRTRTELVRWAISTGYVSSRR